MPADETRAAIDALAGTPAKPAEGEVRKVCPKCGKPCEGCEKCGNCSECCECDEVDEEDESDERNEGGDENEAAVIKDLIEELVKFDIILPEDTDEENFFERLQVGLKTAAAHQGLDEDDEGTRAWDNETTIADAGGVAMMSLQVKGMLGYAERQHRDAVVATLESLLKSGRCTPAEFHERKQAVPALRLSLDETGNPQPTDLEKWIASRQPLPRGTFWGEEEKAKRMAVEVEEPPEVMAGKESDAKVNAVLAAVFGPRK